jgi:hypothetical protein
MRSWIGDRADYIKPTTSEAADRVVHGLDNHSARRARYNPRGQPCCIGAAAESIRRIWLAEFSE